LDVHWPLFCRLISAGAYSHFSFWSVVCVSWSGCCSAHAMTPWTAACWYFWLVRKAWLAARLLAYVVDTLHTWLLTISFLMGWNLMCGASTMSHRSKHTSLTTM
jgi:hypothetical protein